MRNCGIYKGDSLLIGIVCFAVAVLILVAWRVIVSYL